MLRPFNDKVKIEVATDQYGFGDGSTRKEAGVVVEVPDVMMYLGFHSFAFEDSIANEEKLKKIQAFYNELKGKKVIWEALKDSGRHFKEGDKEFVILNVTDIIAYTDNVDDEIQTVDQTGSAGSFNLS